MSEKNATQASVHSGRRRVIFAMGIVSTVVLVVVFAVSWWSVPRHQGLDIEEWFAVACDSGVIDWSRNPEPPAKEAEDLIEAFQALGPDAVRFLLRKSVFRESAFEGYAQSDSRTCP